MAGNYPDVTSWRMAWDVDGTQLFSGTAIDSMVQRSSAAMAALNSENSAEVLASRPLWVCLIFPELRDLDGYFFSVTAGVGFSFGPVQVSSDTTNGVDGTWITVGESYTLSASKPQMRTEISSTTTLGIKAIRAFTQNTFSGYNGGMRSIHLYGEPIPEVNLQRLEIWHPTLDQRLGPADLDWGDVPRDSEEIREFRVKNMHPTLTANDVRVAMSILTDTTPSVLGQQSISGNDGASWAAQFTLSSPLLPEEVSPIFKVRRQTAENATLSLWWYRLFADTTSWT